MILWGQSLGAAVALRAVEAAERPIRGLVLETPFVSMRRMLTSHYPERWLPYRHLWPFLRSRWDNIEALKRLSAATRAPWERDDRRLPILVMQAGKDEVVPDGQAGEIETAARSQGLDVRSFRVGSALHNGIMATGDGRGALAAFVKECTIPRPP